MKKINNINSSNILEIFKINALMNSDNIILTSILMGILSFIINYLQNISLNKINIFNFIDDIKMYFLKYNSITIEGKRTIKNGPHSVRVDNLFGDTFLALFKKINDSLYDRNDIYSIKELSEGYGMYDDWGDVNCSKDTKSVFIVKQNKRFKLTDEIYCTVSKF